MLCREYFKHLDPPLNLTLSKMALESNRIPYPKKLSGEQEQLTEKQLKRKRMKEENKRKKKKFALPVNQGVVQISQVVGVANEKEEDINSRTQSEGKTQIAEFDESQECLVSHSVEKM